MVWATIKKMPFPLHNREFVARQMAATDTNGDFLVVAVPTDEVIDYGMKTRTVRGVSRALVQFSPYGESQCKITYHMNLDAGGRIPTFVVNAKLPLALGAVDNLRIDKLERDQLARVIKDELQTCTAEEDALINKVNVKLGMLEWEHFEELESPDHLVKMGKIFVDGSGRMESDKYSSHYYITSGFMANDIVFDRGATAKARKYFTFVRPRCDWYVTGPKASGPMEFTGPISQVDIDILTEPQSLISIDLPVTTIDDNPPPDGLADYMMTFVPSNLDDWAFRF